MSDETTLLPCPFCGGEAETLLAESMHGGYLFGIMCNDCRSRGDVYDTEAEAIAAWNSRADYHGYEQAAIEAWKSIKAWNTRATHDTLTAEQVREAVEASTFAETSTIREFNDSSWQAIADELNAELGSDDEYEAKMDELLCRLTNGKWSKSRAYSIEFMVSCIDEEFEALYSEEQFSAPVHGTLTAEQVSKATYAHSIHADCADADWQAIADELNAELGSGTCEIVAQTWEDRGGDEEDTYKYELSCGHAVRMLDCEPLHNCPRCGKAVR